MWYLPALRLTIEKIHQDAVTPRYATQGDSGADIYAIEEYFIEPDETVLVRTGLKMDIPKHPHHTQGYRWEMQVRPRSGVSLNTNLRIANAPGTIDNFYRDELKIICHNIHPGKVEFGTDGPSIYLEPKLVNFVFLASGEKVGTEYQYPYGTVLIRKGDRVAQIVFNEVIRPIQIVEGKVTDELSRKSSFGGTGYTT